MARTPSKFKGGKEIPQITAFVVEADAPGVEVTQRCDFMGIKAIQNAVMRFDNVRVPRENIIWGEGKGLKLALMTLNTGRLTLPMSASAGAKACTEIARRWSAERVQWGAPIGKHDAVAQMIGDMASRAFAMESMAELASAMADEARNDIRLEAAIAKLWSTEVGWEIIDDCLQIRGGRGYETADSLRARGEVPIPMERIMRDFRINRIFEGSSEIMRLFIAREAVDTHLQVAGDLLKADLSLAEKTAAFARIGAHYAVWFPQRVIGWGRWPRYSEFGSLATHLRFIDRTSRKLARSLFYAMARFGPKLQYRQAVLGRLVDVGAELFAMSAACVRAQHMSKRANGREATHMADVFCKRSRHRIDSLFDRLFDNADAPTYKLAQEVVKGEHAWLEEGIMGVMEQIGEGQLAPGGGGEPIDPRAGKRKVSGTREGTRVAAGG
jgi:hypothetical protein